MREDVFQQMLELDLTNRRIAKGRYDLIRMMEGVSSKGKVRLNKDDGGRWELDKDDGGRWGLDKRVVSWPD